MNLSPSEEAKLEMLLRKDSASQLADDGFSARVLAALPTSRGPGLGLWLRPALCGLAAAIGLAVALVKGGSWAGLVATTDQLGQVYCNLFADPWLSVALAGVIAACTAAAYLWYEGATD